MFCRGVSDEGYQLAEEATRDGNEETFDGFQCGLQIGGRIGLVTNLRYADDILLATLEAELQELLDCLDRVSRKYSPLVNVDKTKVVATLIQNEQLEQVDTFPYFGFLVTEDGEYTTEFRPRTAKKNKWVGS